MDRSIVEGGSAPKGLRSSPLLKKGEEVTLAKVAYEPLHLEGFFHELDTLLGRALSEAQKKPKARLTLTRLVRLELEEGRIKAVNPSGWKP